MGKRIDTSGLARGKILGRLAFNTWVADHDKPFKDLFHCP